MFWKDINLSEKFNKVPIWAQETFDKLCQGHMLFSFFSIMVEPQLKYHSIEKCIEVGRSLMVVKIVQTNVFDPLNIKNQCFRLPEPCLKLRRSVV